MKKSFYGPNNSFLIYSIIQKVVQRYEKLDAEQNKFIYFYYWAKKTEGIPKKDTFCLSLNKFNSFLT